MTTPLGSRYELVEKIAGGATGSVWRARVTATGEAVAAKQIRAELASDADVVDRFLRERRVLTSIDHPAVVRMRDLVVEGDQISLVMDLVEGADLRHTLAIAGALAPTSAALMAATVADALAAAHAAGVVHADVKPANVLVPEDGGPVRLADFGVARLVHGPARLSYGTPEYIAPEVVQGHASIPASDVYGLGIVFYELLTGTTPYRGGSSAEVMRRHVTARPIWTDAVPDAARPVLTACLQRDPVRRPSAESLAADLRAVAAELAGLPAATPFPEGTPHFHVVPVVESVTGGVEPDERVTSVLPATPRPGALAGSSPDEVTTTVARSARHPSPTLSLAAPVPVAAGGVPSSPAGAIFASAGDSGPGGGTPPGDPVPNLDLTRPNAAPTNIFPAASGPGGPGPSVPSGPSGPGAPGAPGGPGAPSTPGGPPPSFDDTLSPPRWAFPAGTIPPRPPKKRRWPLIVGLVAVCLIVLAAVGVGVAWSGVLSSSKNDSKNEAEVTPPAESAKPTPQDSRTAAPTPSRSDGAIPDAPAGTTIPDLPTPGETMTPPDQTMPPMVTPKPGEPSIGGPIN